MPTSSLFVVMTKIDKSIITLVRMALNEDVGPGDITSLACLEPEMIKAQIVAKSPGVLSGLIPARITFEIVDSANKIVPQIDDGTRFEPGDVIATIEGLNRTVLTAERAALNFLAHLSGVATLTRRFVDLTAGTDCVILDTRKTTPGFRILEKMAVVHGGGQNHRQGLFDMVLIKDNHIAAAGSVTKALEQTARYLRSVDFSRQFGVDPKTIETEIEITTASELKDAIAAGARRLLLDNQSVDSLRSLVKLARSIDPKVKLEASGNMSLETVADYAHTGVDYISVGALTHSAKVCDLSLRVVE